MTIFEGGTQVISVGCIRGNPLIGTRLTLSHAGLGGGRGEGRSPPIEVDSREGLWGGD